MEDKAFDLNILKSKPHFEILNDPRGLASVVEVVFHFMELTLSILVIILFARLLGSSFFFCLSGFLEAYAYDSRIADMALRTFIKVRLIRLQPLVVIGSVLGLLTFFV